MNNFTKSQLREIIQWACNKPKPIVKKEGVTMKQLLAEQQKHEKEWGNTLINQSNNGQWTTLLGERCVYDVLSLLGQNPIKVKRMNGFQPDWECDDYIIEVKTSNWWVSGTAGEKVLGTFIKYQNIPEMYGKPLKIICIANQEYELTYGKTKYFGDITPKTQQLMDLASSWGIEYVKFSDFVKPIMDKLEITELENLTPNI